jgi:hypothetical protein
MTRIRHLVEQALCIGYLTREAEEQLRELLSSQYDLEDLNAFMTLQHAAMSGRVKQESRLGVGDRQSVQRMSNASQGHH